MPKKTITKSNPMGQNEVGTEKAKATKQKKFEDSCKQRRVNPIKTNQ